MEQINNIKAIYENIADKSRQKLSKVQKEIYRIGTIRLVLVIAGVCGVIHFWGMGISIISLIIVATIIPFLLLVVKHNKLFYKKEYLETKIAINEQEIRALNHDFSDFEDGKEFLDTEHLYSLDLDLFGEHSLFQLINRTCTEVGKRRLAEWLANHSTNKKEIEERQKAVQELSTDIQFRQKFRILGLIYKDETTDEEEIIEWANEPKIYKNRSIFRVLPTLAFTINAALAGLMLANIVSLSVFSSVFIGFFFLSILLSKKIGRIQSKFGKKLQIIGTYAKLIHLIEQREMRSSLLNQAKSLVANENKTASATVKELAGLMHTLDQRNNLLMNFLLNGLFLWELRQIIRIENWKEKSAKDLPHWFEAIKQIDALCSLSTFAYNNPSYTYPQIVEENFILQAKQLGHPLMKLDKCIQNDIEISKRPFFIIITGANMAGKSTYLRTVGVNFLLGCIGAPVFAKQMTLCPTQLVTSLRTTDSLNDNESYFFAELKRLKLIIEKLQAGEKLFIILDEILKGTNSLDKQKGSLALISQLLALRTNGIIATHDIQLGKLVEDFPNNINNFCFEAEIKENELHFPYRMKPGVVQNMNACFLMKKMGIAVIDD
ncbi:hypothetical protein D0T50_08280 [Bacteroides sp. 214]|uniref:MutS family DNA mismatch repair protein n=1 Tax=Bacteroides sp. 214 TaxID=2302935 RepID=UPI0013D7AE58|nr:MutS family DNA mismatch repair protein [Bacteroides sp. 214]NDW12888.1 hypothetical protein [Bacteroides sp. 214]